MTTTPPKWTEPQLIVDRQRAIEIFRDERLTEPLDHYLDSYETAYQAIAQVMEQTDDLRGFTENAVAILTDKDFQALARYVASPPLSADDLKTLADTSLAVNVLKDNPAGIAAVVEVILAGFDHARFPWVSEGREPTAAEKQAGLVATAALVAVRRTETWRRGRGRSLERELKGHLASVGLTEVAPTAIGNSTHGPMVGEFCRETSVVSHMADVVVRLWDGRLALIECKVSNSETNSHKRLIHECGDKARAWVQALGPSNCTPIAVLSGCYSLANLDKAQDMGLTLIWAHDFSPLSEFIDSTKP
jgi:hypothetical protein